MWHCWHNSWALWWFIMHTSESPDHCDAFYSFSNLAFLKICLHILWFTSIASFCYVHIYQLDETMNTLLHIYMMLPDFLSFITLQKCLWTVSYCCLFICLVIWNQMTQDVYQHDQQEEWGQEDEEDDEEDFSTIQHSHFGMIYTAFILYSSR